MDNKKKQRGFTLVEVLTVVAIIGIIAGISTTLLLKYLPNMRLKSAARDIFSAVMLAKTEAIKRGDSVAICLNTPLNPNICTGTSGTPTNSYVIFLDNGTGAGGIAADGIINGTETIIIPATPLPNGVSFDPAIAGNGVDFGNSAILFNSRGIPVNAFNGSLGNGTIGLRITDSSGTTTRQRTVTVSSAGRINAD